MDNQHREIKGYRELSRQELDLIGEVKAQGEALESLIERLRESGADPRWASIGTSYLQTGLMALTRSIAKPAGF